MNTITKLPLALFAAVSLAAASSRAQVIFSENFDGQITGANPAGFTSVSPATAIPGTGPGSVGVTVVSLGGGNNAVNLFDYSGTANGRLEEDYTSMSGAHLSLTFTRNADITPSATTAGLYVAMGANGLSQGTSGNRALDIRLFNDGTYRLDVGTQNADGSFGSASLTGSASFEASGPTFGTHTLDIYSYGGTNGDSGLSYKGPDGNTRVLDAHSYAVYMDNALVPGGTTANGNNGFYTSSFYGSPVLGRFAFITGGGSANTNVDFVVDNISLSSISPSLPVTLSNYQATVNGQLPNYYFTFDGGSLTSEGTNVNVVTLAASPNSNPYSQTAPDVFGNANDAVYFTASGDTLVDLNEPSDLIINSGGGGMASTNSTATGTISLLFRTLDPGAYSAQKYIFSGGYTAANHNMMSLYFENTNAANGDPMSLKLRFGDQNVTILQASNVLSDTWYYFAFTYTEATNGYFYDSTGTNLVTVKGKWYLGIPGNTLASHVTTNAIDAVAGEGTFYIGNRSTQTAGFRNPGNGVVDELATWSRRLSDSEVQAQFNALPAISVVPPATLAAYQKVVVTNQAASYFFPLNGNYVDAVSGTLTLQTNTLSSGSYSFAPDWFGDVPGSVVFSASAAALSSSGNLLSGGGTYTGVSGSGKGTVTGLFRTPASIDFTGFATVFSTDGASSTSNLFMLRFDRVTTGNGSLKLYFGDATLTILPSNNIVTSAWYYFAVNYDETLAGDQVHWWLGQPGGDLASGTLNASANTLAGGGNTFVIGNTVTYGSPFRQSSGAPGYLADIGIWQRTLSDSEVTSQFNTLVVAPSAPPTLGITALGSNVILSWPSDTDPSYALKTATNLTSPTWMDAGSPVIVGDQYVVTNAITPNVKFYRLEK